MTPEHIETIIAVHNFSDVPRKKYRDAIDALRVDLYRMRQPITAEALLADGWRIVTLDMYRCPDKYGDLFLFVEFFEGGELRRVTYNTHPFKNCRNMHDLHELVRLLGGKPDSAS